jgi:hypothetical protein
MTAFIVLFSANMPPPGANFIKLFMSVIYELSYLSRVLVRIGSKSFITLGPGPSIIKHFMSVFCECAL